MKPTNDQVSGVLDRLVAVFLTWFLTWAVTKGYITPDQVIGLVAQWSPILIAIGTSVWGWWINRPKAIVQSAAALPQTTVVTSDDLAEATPGQLNIVSIDTNKVVLRLGA